MLIDEYYMDDSHAYNDELATAMHMCDQALAYLYRASDVLVQANSWSVNDFFGDDILGMMGKRTCISRAEEALAAAREVLYYLRIQLSDFQLGSYLIWAEHHPDQESASYVLQTHIDESLAAINETIGSVRSLRELIINELNRYTEWF